MEYRDTYDSVVQTFLTEEEPAHELRQINHNRFSVYVPRNTRQGRRAGVCPKNVATSHCREHNRLQHTLSSFSWKKGATTRKSYLLRRYCVWYDLHFSLWSHLPIPSCLPLRLFNLSAGGVEAMNKQSSRQANALPRFLLCWVWV